MEVEYYAEMVCLTPVAARESARILIGTMRDVDKYGFFGSGGITCYPVFDVIPHSLFEPTSYRTVLEIVSGAVC